MQSTPDLPARLEAIDVSGTRRTFTVLGARTAPRPRPLVLVFHGSKQNGDVHRRFTGDALAPLASDDGAVVAYLDGYRGNWNDARRESSFPARTEGIDDVAFARAVVERLAISDTVDTDRVVMVGYSNGGQMVLRLLHETPDLVASAIIIAATMPAPENFVTTTPPPPARPTAIALVHGTRDRIVPVEGGSMSRWARAVFKVGGRTLSASDTAAYLARRNGISTGPETIAIPPRASSGGRTSIQQTRYEQDGRPAVTLYEVRGGGHTIPGPHAAPRILGRTGTDVALVDLVTEAVRLLPTRRG